MGMESRTPNGLGFSNSICSEVNTQSNIHKGKMHLKVILKIKKKKSQEHQKHVSPLSKVPVVSLRPFLPTPACCRFPVILMDICSSLLSFHTPDLIPPFPFPSSLSPSLLHPSAYYDFYCPLSVRFKYFHLGILLWVCRMYHRYPISYG